MERSFMIADSGPLLARLIAAQDEADEAVAFPALEGFARALVEVVSELGQPVVWPVDEVAHQLAGAAALVGQGQVCVRRQSSTVYGARVLLVAGVALSPLMILDAATQARRMGAVEVRAAGIRIEGIGHVLADGVIDSYICLDNSRDREFVLATPM